MWSSARNRGIKILENTYNIWVVGSPSALVVTTSTTVCPSLKARSDPLQEAKDSLNSLVDHSLRESLAQNHPSVECQNTEQDLQNVHFEQVCRFSL